MASKTSFSPKEKAWALHKINEEKIAEIEHYPDSVMPRISLRIRSACTIDFHEWPVRDNTFSFVINEQPHLSIGWKEFPVFNVKYITDSILGVGTHLPLRNCDACREANVEQEKTLETIERIIIPDQRDQFYSQVIQNLLHIQEVLGEIISTHNIVTTDIKKQLMDDCDQIKKALKELADKYKHFLV